MAPRGDEAAGGLTAPSWWCTSTKDSEEPTGTCRLGDDDTSTGSTASIRPAADEDAGDLVGRGEHGAADPRLARGDTVLT